MTLAQPPFDFAQGKRRAASFPTTGTALQKAAGTRASLAAKGGYRTHGGPPSRLGLD